MKSELYWNEVQFPIRVCAFCQEHHIKTEFNPVLLKTSLSLRVKRVTDEDGEVRDGTTRPFGLFSPSVTSPPTWKAGRTDRLPHFPLNSAEKRRRFAPLLSFHAETTQKMKCDHAQLLCFPCPLEGRWGRRAQNIGTRHQPAFPRGKTKASSFTKLFSIDGLVAFLFENEEILI